MDANDLELESWIVEVGHGIFVNRSAHGAAALTPIESLIGCLWIADYGMRNAGDLAGAVDSQPQFRDEAVSISARLGLLHTHALFSLAVPEFESVYFDVLEVVVDEIRSSYDIERVR